MISVWTPWNVQHKASDDSYKIVRNDNRDTVHELLKHYHNPKASKRMARVSADGFKMWRNDNSHHGLTVHTYRQECGLNEDCSGLPASQRTR